MVNDSQLKKDIKALLPILGVILVMALVWFMAAVSGPRVLFAGTEPSEKPLRLHILAASDEPTDQQIKLAVRDRVVEYLEPCLRDCRSKEQALEVLQQQLPLIEQVCDTALAAQGVAYRSQAHLETADFPSIDYDGLTLAAGAYDALRITLGNGAGHNWWCVLFPPLCFVDLAAEADEEAVLAAWSQASDGGEPVQYEREAGGSGYRIAWKLLPDIAKHDR